MKVTETTYRRRFNTGQYEYADYEVKAELEEDDNLTEVLANLKTEVACAHNETAPEPEEEEVEVEEEEEEEVPAKTKKKSKKVVEEDPEEEEEETEEETEEEVEEETEEEEEEEVPTKKKASKKLKKKPQVYQRTNETHKDLFSKALTAVAPKWKATPESKAKAKKVSMKMQGKAFLDDNGKVLPEFSKELKKLFGK